MKKAKSKAFKFKLNLDKDASKSVLLLKPAAITDERKYSYKPEINAFNDI